MKIPEPEQILRIACMLALVALALMVWSLFDPRPLPVVVAMSLGQVVGTLSLAAFLGVVFVDIRRAQRSRAPQEDVVPLKRKAENE